jgi:hypothetical protein
MNKIPIEALPVLSVVFFMSVVPNSSSVIAIYIFFFESHSFSNPILYGFAPGINAFKKGFTKISSYNGSSAVLINFVVISFLRK